MEYTFASHRQLSFVVSARGSNMLISFGNRNQAGVAVFMTKDEKVANAIRRHSLSRRGIIEETTKQKPVEAAKPTIKPVATVAKTVPVTEKQAPKTAVSDAEPKEREYDNYTVARESICKELGIKKTTVRNPETLALVAKEHGIIIKYKEL